MPAASSEARRSWLLLHVDHGDRREIAHPTRRPFLFSRDKLERSVRPKFLAIHRVGHDDISEMDGWVNFSEGVEDAVAVCTLRDHANHEELSFDVFSLWGTNPDKKIRQNYTRILLIRFCVAVEHRNCLVGQSGQLLGRNVDGLAVQAAKGQPSGWRRGP